MFMELLFRYTAKLSVLTFCYNIKDKQLNVARSGQRNHLSRALYGILLNWLLTRLRITDKSGRLTEVFGIKNRDMLLKAAVSSRHSMSRAYGYSAPVIIFILLFLFLLARNSKPLRFYPL